MGIAPYRRKLNFAWEGNCDNIYLEKFKPLTSFKICSDLNTMPDVKMFLLQPVVVTMKRSLNAEA